MKLKEVSNLLNACREFAKSQTDKFDRGFIGELLVYEGLLKTYRKSTITFYGGSNKKFDILLGDGKIAKIEVKSTKHYKGQEPEWVRQNAKTYAHVKQKKNKQEISPKKDGDGPDYYAYVDVRKWLNSGKADFYLVTGKKANEIFKNKYAPDGVIERPKNKKSTDLIIELKDIKKYKNNKLDGIKLRKKVDGRGEKK